MKKISIVLFTMIALAVTSCGGGEVKTENTDSTGVAVDTTKIVAVDTTTVGTTGSTGGTGVVK